MQKRATLKEHKAKHITQYKVEHEVTEESEIPLQIMKEHIRKYEKVNEHQHNQTTPMNERTMKNKTNLKTQT